MKMKFKPPKVSQKLNKATSSMGDRNLIATLMAVTTVLVSISFVLSRLWLGDISFTNKVLDRKKTVNNTLEQNVAALPELESNFQALESNGPKPQEVMRALPTSEEYSDFAKELEAVASLAGAQLVSVVKTVPLETPPEITGPPMPVQMSLQASVVGDYASLKKFMALAEQTVRPLRVNKAVFNGADPAVTLALDMATWWQSSTIVGDDKEVIQE